MNQLVLGVVFGGFASWLITMLYYKKSSRDLDAHTRRITREFSRQEYHEILELVLKSHPQEDWFSISPGSIGNVKWVSYRSDVRIHFRTSYEKQSSNFHEEWANKHPSREAVGYWYFLHFAEVPLYEFLIVSVDGGRAHIPAPRTIDGKITPLDYKVAQIMGYSDRLDEYIARSGLELADSAPI